jgi:transcriptional regulator with PAS, ATPase and Fis domain
MGMPIEKSVLAQWERLHRERGARAELDEVKRAGWERSAALRVDRERKAPKLSALAFQRVKRETKKLFIYANSILQPMFIRSPYETLGGVLFDDKGVLLRLYGPKGFLRWAAENSIEEGALWSEDAIGANIFALGIKQARGMKMEGAENYARFLLGGAYYFSPITLQNGEVCGGLALGVPYEERGDHYQTFALMAARIIELQFFWFGMAEAYGDSSDGQGMITLDRSTGENHVLTMSKEVFKMLGAAPRDCYYETLENFIDPPPANREFWDAVAKGIRVTDRRFEIRVNGKPHDVCVSVSPFCEEKFHMKGLVIMVNSIQRISRLVAKYACNTARYRFSDIIGNNSACIETLNRSKIAAGSDSNILLLGESGVGKEVFAQSIHNGSRRKNGPFVAINCAAFSKELIASELFGYENGAFTGAKKGGSVGKFELADTGTLFLDEIGDMPLNLQALLLRVIEERSFMKVGGNTTVQVDVRIIAATNINLAEHIRQGRFREDLFYRLGIVRIRIPPLRERGDDVLLLADRFISQICARLGKPLVALSNDAKAFFRKYRWPGNVRELQNLLEGIISTHDETVIRIDFIRLYLGNMMSEPPPENVPSVASDLYDARGELICALRACRNNRTKTAEYLGVSRRTLYRHMEKYGLL